VLLASPFEVGEGASEAGNPFVMIPLCKGTGVALIDSVRHTLEVTGLDVHMTGGTAITIDEGITHVDNDTIDTTIVLVGAFEVIIGREVLELAGGAEDSGDDVVDDGDSCEVRGPVLHFLSP